MGTTQTEIRDWFRRGKGLGATHMIIVCDTFSYEDYPKFVMPGEDARKAALTLGDMQRIMEVYNLAMDADEQIAGGKRVFNY